MTRDRWEKLIDRLDEQFGNISSNQVPLDDESGGTCEVVEFNSPLGEVKLEFVEKPRMVGEKTSYSNRIGGHVNVEKEYDENDLVGYMNAYKKENDEWVKIDANKFAQ